MIKIKMTYKDLQEKEQALDKLRKIFIIKSISKEYARAKASDLYVDVEVRQ